MIIHYYRNRSSR